MLTYGNLKTLTRSLAKDDASACTDEIMRYFAELLMEDLILRTGGWWLYDEHTFASVAAQGEYAFPSRFLLPLKLWDVDNECEVEKLGAGDEQDDPDRGDSGTPRCYKYSYTRQVQAQPSSASVITAASTSTDDTSSYTMRVRGLDANDVEIAENITLNGTTSVATTTSFTEVWSITKNKSSNGIVTVTSNAGAVTLVRLASEELSRDHQWIRMLEAPSAIINYRLDFIRKASIVSDDKDRLEAPELFTRALALHLEYLVKHFFYDVSDEKVFAAYLEAVQLTNDRLGKTPSDRWIHRHVGAFASQRTGHYQPPIAGYISRRA